jgi:hypothetical protein
MYNPRLRKNRTKLRLLCTQSLKLVVSSIELLPVKL